MALWDEILEQPDVLDRLLRAESDNVARVAAWLRGRDVRFVVVAARGTSDNAARYAQYLWGARNRLLVALAAPSLFGPYEAPPALDAALVVAVSQSGQSPDVVSVLAEARRQGRPTIAVTNDPDSPMAAEADEVIALHAGEEQAVAATKTYTAELIAVAMLSAALAEDESMRSTMARLPELVGETLDQSSRIEPLAQALRDLDRAAVLGRGFNLCTAFEWALKLQEMSEVLAQPFSAADFEHGPVAVVEPGFPVFAVLPPGPVHDDIEALALRLRDQRGARLLVISRADQRLDHAVPSITLPASVPEWLSPIPAIVGGQLFSYHLAVAKALDPDRPRHLRKVTRTR